MIADAIKVNGRLMVRLKLNLKWLNWPVPSCDGCQALCCQGVARGAERCARLFGQKCTVYADRPARCKLYPFYIDHNCTLTLDPSALWSTCLPGCADRGRHPAWKAHSDSLTECFGEGLVTHLHLVHRSIEDLGIEPCEYCVPVRLVPWPTFEPLARLSHADVRLPDGVGVGNDW